MELSKRAEEDMQQVHEMAKCQYLELSNANPFFLPEIFSLNLQQPYTPTTVILSETRNYTTI
jgi:hypothetical protein